MFGRITSDTGYDYARSALDDTDLSPVTTTLTDAYESGLLNLKKQREVDISSAYNNYLQSQMAINKANTLMSGTKNLYNKQLSSAFQQNQSSLNTQYSEAMQQLTDKYTSQLENIKTELATDIGNSLTNTTNEMIDFLVSSMGENGKYSEYSDFITTDATGKYNVLSEQGMNVLFDSSIQTDAYGNQYESKTLSDTGKALMAGMLNDDEFMQYYSRKNPTEYNKLVTNNYAPYLNEFLTGSKDLGEYVGATTADALSKSREKTLNFDNTGYKYTLDDKEYDISNLYSEYYKASSEELNKDYKRDAKEGDWSVTLPKNGPRLNQLPEETQNKFELLTKKSNLQFKEGDTFVIDDIKFIYKNDKFYIAYTDSQLKNWNDLREYQSNRNKLRDGEISLGK